MISNSKKHCDWASQAASTDDEIVRILLRYETVFSSVRWKLRHVCSLASFCKEQLDQLSQKSENPQIHFAEIKRPDSSEEQ